MQLQVGQRDMVECSAGWAGREKRRRMRSLIYIETDGERVPNGHYEDGYEMTASGPYTNRRSMLDKSMDWVNRVK